MAIAPEIAGYFTDFFSNVVEDGHPGPIEPFFFLGGYWSSYGQFLYVGKHVIFSIFLLQPDHSYVYIVWTALQCTSRGEFVPLKLQSVIFSSRYYSTVVP